MRRILVPLTGSAAERSALMAAIAAVPDAHVDVRLFRPNPKDVPLPFEGDLSGQALVQLEAAAEARGEDLHNEARALFNEWASSEKVTVGKGVNDGTMTADFEDILGPTPEQFFAPARLADLIVFARPKKDDLSRELLLTAALFETGRPVIVAPTTKKRWNFSQVAVAWNGSAEAASAVATAMPLLSRAENVTVITVRDDASRGADARDLAETLKMNGIKAKAKNVKKSSRSTLVLLNDEVTAANAGLLVLGAYSHSRLREFVFGGVTSEIVENYPIPVLMAH